MTYQSQLLTIGAAADAQVADLTNQLTKAKADLAAQIAADDATVTSLKGVIADLTAQLAALQPAPPVTPPTPPPPVPPTPPARTQLKTYKMTSADSGKTFENVDFVGGDASTAVLSFLSACSHITLKNCTIAAGPWNGVSINVSNGNIHDITFDGCHIMASARMGIECTQRPASNTVGYSNIKVLNTIIEAVGEEALSFDGGYFPATGCEIGNVTIYGSNNSANPQWSGALEINGPTGFSVHDVMIYACKKHALNLEGPAGKCGHVFRRVTIDYSNVAEKYATDSVNAYMMEFQSVNGAVFDLCKFNTGSMANHCAEAGTFSNSSGNDFSTSTLTGVVNDLPSNPTAASYFRLSGTCTGNIWPVLK